MSEGRRTVMATLLLLLFAQRAEAQDRTALVAEVSRWEGRVDSLREVLGRAALLDSATIPGPRAPGHLEDLDLVLVGRYRFRTNPSPLDVRAAATEAWERLTGYFGEEGERFVPRPLVVQGLDPDTNAGELDGIADLTLPWDLPRETVVYSLLQSAGMPPADSALQRWLGAAPSPAMSLDDALALGYEALTLSPFSRGHACIVGDLASCRIALGADVEGAGVEREFPAPEDRRRAVLILLRRPHPATEEEVVAPCISAGDDAACVAILGATDPAFLPVLSDRSSRLPLLELALRRGGSGAYHRLIASAGRPIAARLESAAGLPLDSLLSTWVGEMSRARHAARPWSSRVGFAGLGWAGLLALCALWSSRWRAD